MIAERFKIWVKAVRAPFFTATIIPVVLGAIIAWHNGASFNWAKFWLTLVGIIFIHIGTNLINDYFDHVSGCDKANLTPTPFSGGSRVIQDGLVAPKSILYVALSAFAIGSLIGLYLNYVSGNNVIVVIGIIGVFLAFFYSATVFPIGYKAFGELAIGLSMGPLIVVGSYFVQARDLSLQPLLASIPLGILIALVVFINEFPDYAADKSVKKNTLVVVLGKKKALLLYYALLALTYLYVFVLVVLKAIPVTCLIVFLSLPLALKAFAVSKKNFERIYELIPANASTVGLHLIFGLLLCSAYTIDKFLIK